MKLRKLIEGIADAAASLESAAGRGLMKRIPVFGIIAFSGCSVNALAHLFMGNAVHPAPWYWLAACLVEGVTAWLVWACVGVYHQLTRTRQTRQDRRFFLGVALDYVLLALLPLSVSVYANGLEFGGGWGFLLGAVFPALSVACAIGAAMPETVAGHKRRKARQKAEEEAEKAKNEARRAEEERRKTLEDQRKEEEAQRKEAAKLAQNLEGAGAARATYDALAADPSLTRAEVAQRLGLTPQTVSGHLIQLESLGLVERDNGKISIRGKNDDQD